MGAEPSFEQQVREILDPALRRERVRAVQRARRDAAAKCRAAAETERQAVIRDLPGASEAAVAMAERLAATFRDLAQVAEYLDDEGNSG